MRAKALPRGLASFRRGGSGVERGGDACVALIHPNPRTTSARRGGSGACTTLSASDTGKRIGWAIMAESPQALLPRKGWSLDTSGYQLPRPCTTLLANDTRNRREIMQHPDVAKSDAMLGA